MSDIYSDIYDITSVNLSAAKKKFSVSKEAFMELSNIHPQNADIFILSSESDNKLFMEKSYIRLLKRLADDRALDNWSEWFKLPNYEFQRLMTMTLVTSAEFSEIDVSVYNNIYSQHNQYGGRLSKTQLAIDVRNSEFKIKVFCALRKIYNRMPETIKKVARKVFAKWRNV